jgi:hypothetical protein
VKIVIILVNFPILLTKFCVNHILEISEAIKQTYSRPILMPETFLIAYVHRELYKDFSLCEL